MATVDPKDSVLTPDMIKLAEMLKTNDEPKIGSQFVHWDFIAYVNHIFKVGLEARERSIKYTLDRREKDAAAEKTARGIEQFKTILLQNPQQYQTLESLLTLGTQCHVPAQLVLEYYQARTKTQGNAQTKTA